MTEDQNVVFLKPKSLHLTINVPKEIVIFPAMILIVWLLLKIWEGKNAAV